MKQISMNLGLLALLGLAESGIGQGVAPKTLVPPAAGKKSSQISPDRTKKGSGARVEGAEAQRNIAEAYRYTGTTVIPSRDLDAANPQVKKICEMLSGADMIPDQRVLRFSGLDPRFTVVGWHLTVEKLDVGENDSLVRIRAAPLLRAPGEGKIGVFTFYRENYRVSGGKLQFVGGEPIPKDLSINTAIQ